MKRNFIVNTLFLVVSGLSAGNNPEIPNGFKEQKSIGIAFTENKGQVHDQNYKARPDVLFSGTDGRLVFHLKNNGISYQLNRIDSYKEEEDFKTKNAALSLLKEKRKVVDQSTIYRIDINWLNANVGAAVKRGNALEGFNNYYLEHCPNGALYVKSYEQVEYVNVYTGINLKWYQHNGQLKYDYIVAPHANYKQINLEIKGAELQLQKNGSLLLKTPLGSIEEHAPVVYQNGKKLKANYVLKENVLSFNIEKYDPNQALIIDPVVRIWGTYYGGNGADYSRSCSTDALGNVYLAGYTTSNTGTIMATVGAHQSVIGGSNDAFLVKFDAGGVRQWGTYYGGTGNDIGWFSNTDASGNVYLAGYTNSGTSSVIATVGAHQTSNGGGSNDAFLVKFDVNGLRQWGTYYGGSGNDQGQSCTTDAAGNVYLVGLTNTSTGTVIATIGAHQSTHGGAEDAFLVKFDAAGVRQWGTYYGGGAIEYGYACSSDAAGNVYLAGLAQSTTGTVIATAGSHQNSFGGINDAFLAKFNAAGVRQWGTYYGGSTQDWGFACTTDVFGNVYLTGWTQSTDGTVIATPGSHQTFMAGIIDAFLVKFDANGVRQWGTYYGGIDQDEGHTCATDASGNVYLGGVTNTSTGTLIATAGSHQSVIGGGNDAFLVKFNASGVRQWGTYYGGIGTDYARSCATDAIGNVYLAGYTNSNTGTVIATSAAHQSVQGGSDDAFLVKLTDCANLSPTATVSSSLCSGVSINFTATINGTSTPTYTWAGPNSFTASVQNPVIAGAGTIHVGIYTLTVNNGGCVETVTTQVSAVYASPTVAVNNGAICSGNSFTIVPSGASTYTIEGGNAVVSPTANTSYTVIGASVEGCLSANTATSNITVNTLPTVAVNNGTICSGNSFTIVPSGASTYTIEGGNAVVSPTANTTYTIMGTSSLGCLSANNATSNVTVNANPTITAISNQTLCLGNSFTLTPSGGISYTVAQGLSLPASFANSIIITPTAGLSIYTVTGTNSLSCSGSKTLSTLVNPNPNVTAVTSATNFICVGESATLTASGANSYAWMPVTSSGTSIVVSPTITSSFTVTGTDANGCSASVVITQSVDPCTGIKSGFSNLTSGFMVYPNPSNGIFNVQIEHAVTIEITDVLGRVIITEKVDAGNYQLNLGEHVNGIYFVKATVDGKTKTLKIIKE